MAVRALAAAATHVSDETQKEKAVSLMKDVPHFRSVPASVQTAVPFTLASGADFICRSALQSQVHRKPDDFDVVAYICALKVNDKDLPATRF